MCLIIFHQYRAIWNCRPFSTPQVQGPSDFSVVSGSPFYFTSDVSAGVTIASVNAGLGNLSASFTFVSIHLEQFGSFDQDSIETGISDTVTAMCRAAADASGASLASIQAGFPNQSRLGLE